MPLAVGEGYGHRADWSTGYLAPMTLSHFGAPLLAILAVLGPSTAWAQWKAPPRDSILRVLQDRIEHEQAVGLVVGMLESGTPRIVAAGRKAGPGSPSPDDTTVFEIGSITKVFTTTLLADMVVRGKMALDDPVQRYLPATVRMPSRDGKAITLLDLATASSGLPRLPSNLKPKDQANPYADYTVAQLYEFLSGYELPRDPGAQYEYSNLGMGLLGHVLGLVSGTSFESALRERVLAPLGMTETGITLTAPLRARMAQGHGPDLKPVANWDIPTLAGAGALRSTMRDMLTFMAANLEPTDTPLAAAIALAHEPRRPAGSPALRIGLGWHILEREGRTIIWHNGGTGGYHSFMGFDPASGANAVVLSNASTDIDDIGLHLIDPGIPLRPLPKVRKEIAVDPAILDRYVGRYELSPAFAIEIMREGNQLTAQATGQGKLPLSAESETEFFFRGVDAQISFTKDAAGAVTGLVLHQGGRDTPGRRVP